MLIGNLGKDPDTQHLEGHIAVAKFPLATTETFKDRSGKLISQTEWQILGWGIAQGWDVGTVKTFNILAMSGGSAM